MNESSRERNVACTQKGMEKMEEKIRQRLESMRSMLQADGGDLEVVEIEGPRVKLKLKGACRGCPHSAMTVQHGLQRVLREEIDPSIEIESV